MLGPACGGDDSGGNGGHPNGDDASGGDGQVSDSPAGGDDAGHDAGPIVAPQPLSPFIIVDQFGYRPNAEKIAVVRNPKTGFDAATQFAPGAKYAVVEAHAGNKVALEGAPTPWNGGATDKSSGDQAWWLDFSSVTTTGDYYVLDETQNVRSDVFRIASDVYRDVMKNAMRMLYYQRDGIAKDAQYAGIGWADGVAHPQDAQCHLYSALNDPATQKDVHGGWFDAGDQNRYSNWAAVDVIQLLRAYTETPSAFTDDYGIPESGNGTPDVLDEARWELDWLLRMQNGDGSMLSFAGHAGASPPSKDASPCKYGSASTSASFSGAAVFAFASVVYKSIDAAYSTQLQAAATNAWTWAQAHPGVTFYNTQHGMGGGEQEMDAYGVSMRELEAALYLFWATGDATYRQYFDASYKQAHMFSYGNYASMWEGEPHEMLLDYTRPERRRRSCKRFKPRTRPACRAPTTSARRRAIRIRISRSSARTRGAAI
jgi:hypothetical protein